MENDEKWEKYHGGKLFRRKKNAVENFFSATFPPKSMERMEHYGTLKS